MRVLTDRLFGRGRTPPHPHQLPGWRSPLLFHTHAIVPVQEFHWYSREFSFPPMQFSLLFSFGLMNVDPCDPPHPSSSTSPSLWEIFEAAFRWLTTISAPRWWTQYSELSLPSFTIQWFSARGCCTLKEADQKKQGHINTHTHTGPPSLCFLTSVKTHLTLRWAYISPVTFSFNLHWTVHKTCNYRPHAVLWSYDRTCSRCRSPCWTLNSISVLAPQTNPRRNISFSLTGTLCRECLAFLNLTLQMGHYLKRPWDREENKRTHTQGAH